MIINGMNNCRSYLNAIGFTLRGERREMVCRGRGDGSLEGIPALVGVEISRGVSAWIKPRDSAISYISVLTHPHIPQVYCCYTLLLLVLYFISCVHTYSRTLAPVYTHFFRDSKVI